MQRGVHLVESNIRNKSWPYGPFRRNETWHLFVGFEFQRSEVRDPYFGINYPREFESESTRVNIISAVEKKFQDFSLLKNDYWVALKRDLDGLPSDWSCISASNFDELNRFTNELQHHKSSSSQALDGFIKKIVNLALTVDEAIKKVHRDSE